MCYNLNSYYYVGFLPARAVLIPTFGGKKCDTLNLTFGALVAAVELD